MNAKLEKNAEKGGVKSFTFGLYCDTFYVLKTRLL